MRYKENTNVTRRNKRILIIPDTHAPFHHQDTVPFLRAVKKKYRPTRIIHIGDEIDGNSWNFHDKDPDASYTPSQELEKALEFMKQLYKLFPKVDVMESNHGSLFMRKAKTAGIPRNIIKSYATVLDAPSGWKWHYNLRLRLPTGQMVKFHHGEAKNAFTRAKNTMTSVVYGHYHTELRVACDYIAGNLIFGMNSGCLIDVKAYAFAYGKAFEDIVKLGCSLIIDGHPITLPMLIDEQGRWTGKLI